MINELAPMIGKTITKITGGEGDYEMIFADSEGYWFRFYHEQDCCESVYICDICGDLDDLIGSPLLMAEEVSNTDEPLPEDIINDDSHTWTFYKFATNKGSVTVRWLGQSNGYYSESVSFHAISPPDE